MSGWIKLHRSITENPMYFSEPFTRIQAWTDLILIANHKKGYIYYRGNKVELNRGDVGHSQVKLAERWKWSRGKVIRFLNELEKEQQIVQQKNNLTSIISIVNYNHYQGGDTADDTTNSTADGQQTDSRQYTNNNDKKNKNEKNNKIKIGNEDFFVKSQFIEFLNEMQEDQIWLEPICMNKRISVDEMIVWLKKFFIELTNDNDETERDLSEYKKYFNRWLTSKLDRQEKENSQNKQEPKEDEKLCKWEIPQLGDQRKGTYKQYMIDKNRNSNLEINFLGFLN
ncbi:DUF7833 domain-containing protein [Dysgonomonas massiliensis]|uniref:DUF7833 domain-containing protein n=1 Tax=Dysgonomonas massiliensis TaxID=2040292 RepID=UPI000C76B86E|nr:hypothetical protein [Dysgonomonas massiliensis]